MVSRIIIGLAVAMLFIPGLSYSESILWDVLIQANLENSVLWAGQNPTITGKITDHAGKPIQNAEVNTKTGILSFFTTSDKNGMFKQELTGFDGLPGSYMINVKASTDDGKIGMESLQFQVRGEVKQSEILLRQIETPTAQKYIQSNESDYQNDVIGLQLYKYYQDLFKDYEQAIAIENNFSEQEIILNQQREVAYNLLQQEIEEKNPGAGIYEGWDYDRFVDNLDLSIKDTIVNQLNHTTTTFFEAQQMMNEIIENGGTQEAARQSYLDRLSITQEMMYEITYGHSTNKNSTNVEVQMIDKESEKEKAVDKTQETILNTNSTQIQVETNGNSIFININGTLIEFLVNGTQVIQITNSTN